MRFWVAAGTVGNGTVAMALLAMALLQWHCWQSVPDSLYLIGTAGAASGLILVSGHVQCFKLGLYTVFSKMSKKVQHTL